MEKEGTQEQVIDAANEVRVKSRRTLASYGDFLTPEEKDKVASLAGKLKGKRIMFVNSTPHGGGVAIMRHDLLPLLEDIGLDAHWYVLIPDAEIFLITKRKFHDILQGVARDGESLSDSEKEIYEAWSAQNAEFLKKAVQAADLIVIDDMQPSGLIPHIKEDNKAAKIVYRSHIQIETPLLANQQSAAAKTWRYLWKNISLADVFVSHPVASFVPQDVPKEKVVFMPPFIDPLSALNREMSEKEVSEKMELLNAILKHNGQTPLDLRRPYVCQISRFDPSKGIIDVLSAYGRLAAKLKAARRSCPQLVIAGNPSIDDPESSLVFNQAMDALRAPEFDGVRKDVKLAILSPDDLLLNAILRRSKVAMQLSVSEGFEFKVTEALMKGKPVVGCDVGGIPLQIKDGVNGFLVPPGAPQKAADRLFELLTDARKYKAASAAAVGYYDRSILIVPNAIRWMEIWTKLLGKE